MENRRITRLYPTSNYRSIETIFHFRVQPARYRGQDILVLSKHLTLRNATNKQTLEANFGIFLVARRMQSTPRGDFPILNERGPPIVEIPRCYRNTPLK